LPAGPGRRLLHPPACGPPRPGRARQTAGRLRC